MALPPDVFLDDSLVSTRTVKYAAGYTPNTQTTSYLVPLAHARTPTAGSQVLVNSSWIYNAQIEGISAKASSLGAKSLNLLEERNPLLVEITVGHHDPAPP